MPQTNFRSFADTHVGQRRIDNQDTFIHDSALGLFAAIDGVGGYSGGDVAAALARDTILARFEVDVLDPRKALKEALVYANNRILQERGQREGLSQMACVATVALVHGGRLYAAHVGDTRLYKLHPPAAITKLTHDHSLVGMREDAGELTELDAMRHPRRNEIMRDLGSEPRGPDDDFVDLLDTPFDPDAAFLLCSDGLTDLVPRHKLERLLLTYAHNPESAVRALIAAANGAGGTDNITAVVIQGPAFGGASRPPDNDDTAPLPTFQPSDNDDTAPQFTTYRPSPRPQARPSMPPDEAEARPLPPKATGRRRFPCVTLTLQTLAVIIIAGGGIWFLLKAVHDNEVPTDDPTAVPALVGQRTVCPPAPSLQFCLDAADPQPGDTLVVPAGTYGGIVQLPAGVTLTIIHPVRPDMAVPPDTAAATDG